MPTYRNRRTGDTVDLPEGIQPSPATLDLYSGIQKQRAQPAVPPLPGARGLGSIQQDIASSKPVSPLDMATANLPTEQTPFRDIASAAGHALVDIPAPVQRIADAIKQKHADEMGRINAIPENQLGGFDALKRTVGNLPFFDPRAVNEVTQDVAGQITPLNVGIGAATAALRGRTISNPFNRDGGAPPPAPPKVKSALIDPVRGNDIQSIGLGRSPAEQFTAQTGQMWAPSEPAVAPRATGNPMKGTEVIASSRPSGEQQATFADDIKAQLDARLGKLPNRNIAGMNSLDEAVGATKKESANIRQTNRLNDTRMTAAEQRADAEHYKNQQAAAAKAETAVAKPAAKAADAKKSLAEQEAKRVAKLAEDERKRLVADATRAYKKAATDPKSTVDPFQAARDAAILDREATDVAHATADATLGQESVIREPYRRPAPTSGTAKPKPPTEPPAAAPAAPVTPKTPPPITPDGKIGVRPPATATAAPEQAAAADIVQAVPEARKIVQEVMGAQMAKVNEEAAQAAVRKPPAAPGAPLAATGGGKPPSTPPAAPAAPQAPAVDATTLAQLKQLEELQAGAGRTPGTINAGQPPAAPPAATPAPAAGSPPPINFNEMTPPGARVEDILRSNPRFQALGPGGRAARYKELGGANAEARKAMGPIPNKGETGGITPEMAGLLLRTTGGGLAGGALDQEHPWRGAAIGAGLGLASGMPMGEGSRIRQALDAFDKIRYEGMLSGGAQVTNMVGNIGGMVSAPIVRALQGDPVAMQQLVEAYHPKNAWPQFKSGFREGFDSSNMESTKFGTRPIGPAGRALRGVDRGVKNIMESGGMTPREAQVFTYSGDPVTGPGKALEMGQSNPIGRLVAPFVRTAINAGELGASLTPMRWTSKNLQALTPSAGPTSEAALGLSGLAPFLAALNGYTPSNSSASTLLGAYTAPAQVGSAIRDYQMNGKGGAANVARSVVNQVPFLGDVVKFTENPQQALEHLATQPMPAGLYALDRMLGGGHVKETKGIKEAVQDRVPFWRDSLPDRRNFWGEPLQRNFLGQYPQPLHSKDNALGFAYNDPVAGKLAEAGVLRREPSPSYTMSAAEKAAGFAKPDTHETSRLQELRGQSSKRILTAVVNSPNFSKMSPEAQQAILRMMQSTASEAGTKAFKAERMTKRFGNGGQ